MNVASFAVVLWSTTFSVVRTQCCGSSPVTELPSDWENDEDWSVDRCGNETMVR